MVVGLALLSLLIAMLLWRRKVYSKKKEFHSEDSNYSNIPLELKPLQTEIKYSEIIMGSKVGSGAFGEVFDARW